MEGKWTIIDIPDMLNRELQIELRTRRRAERNNAAEPDQEAVSFWRRVSLKLEKHTLMRIWQEAFKVIMAKSLRQDTCRHDDVSQLKKVGNKFASQTHCGMCKKTIVYEHTREGVISWMRMFDLLVTKKVLPPIPMEMHPSDPDAYKYCMRCAHPMERVKTVSYQYAMYQCSQHSAKEPCPFARNGHYPPGDHRAPRSSSTKTQEEKDKHRKKKMWLEHDTVTTAENVKISGSTINTIGNRYKDASYKEIFENGPSYVDWAIATAPPGSSSSVELKHMASFFLAAHECRILCNADAQASESPNACGSTTQPRGPGSFKKGKTPKAKAKSANPEHYDMETSDETPDN